MKKFIGLGMCLLMLAGCVSVSDVDEEEIEEESQEVVVTQTIEYLSDADFSQLYKIGRAHV